MGFSGKTPTNLGISDGRFTAPPTWKPNWVNSQVDTGDKHYIAPLSLAGNTTGAVNRLKSVIEKMDGAKIVQSKPDYLYVQFSTKLMGFVDDLEFYFDGKLIQLRSSSRLGIRDFGVNRKRIEAIRNAFPG